MKYTIQPKAITDSVTDALIVPVTGNPKTWKKNKLLKRLDTSSGGQIAHALQLGDLEPKPGKCLMIPAPKGLKAKRLMIFYADHSEQISDEASYKFAQSVATRLSSTKAASAVLDLRDLQPENAKNCHLIRQLVLKLAEATYQFTDCKGKPPGKKYTLKKIQIAPPGNTTKADAERTLAEAQAITRAIELAKNLGNLPGNECTPSFLAKTARQLAAKSKQVRVDVLSEAQMKKLKMGALLSVAAGTVEPAKLIVLEYKGGKRSEAPVALVGKGITFDSGGISLKPGARMDEMKFDMCGAASVLGAFEMLISLKLPMNVVGVIAATENMPSGTATKPGDVVKSMAGVTIEILNTDAEGRLVLCDALTYVADKFKPKCIVDMATLTGACVVALGNHASGLYANDEALAEKLLQAGQHIQDRAWRMPLWDEYKRQIDSPVADIANIGSGGAGSVTAACFLARFTEKQRWAHFDIAGTAWSSNRHKGATGRPVPLLCQFLLNECLAR